MAFKDENIGLDDPLPCLDDRRIGINWHSLSDFQDIRSTIIKTLKQCQTDFADQFAEVNCKLDNAMPGFEQVYLSTGTALSGTYHIIRHWSSWASGLQYLITDVYNPRKDPRAPHSQQQIIQFTVKQHLESMWIVEMDTQGRQRMLTIQWIRPRIYQHNLLQW